MDRRVLQGNSGSPRMSEGFASHRSLAEHRNRRAASIDPLHDPHQHPFGYVKIAFSRESIQSQVVLRVGLLRQIGTSQNSQAGIRNPWRISNDEYRLGKFLKDASPIEIKKTSSQHLHFV